MKPKTYVIKVPAMGTRDRNNLPAYFPWIDTGIDVTAGQRLTIIATGRVNAFGATNPEGTGKWVGPNGNSGAYSVPPWLDNYDRMSLVGCIRSTPPSTYQEDGAFGVGEFLDQGAPTTGRLYLGVNDTSWWDKYLGDWFLDNQGAFTVRVILDGPAERFHDVDCPFANDKKPRTDNPIELDPGAPNKVLTVTDLSVQTPAGPLAFERHYSMVKCADAHYRFMGLGWSHNHTYTLTLNGENAEVAMPDGGTLEFENGPYYFTAKAGSSATLYKVHSNYHHLTTQDKSVFVFGPTADPAILHLTERRWPNGEVWTYTYIDNKLSEVDDGYGRKLKFSYMASSAYDDGQLWRVGDHTATDLETNTPSGRYVEFGYVPEKVDGSPIANPKALLASVGDVRGNTWGYDYFGQHTGETTAEILNVLTKRVSPAGLILEALTYTPEVPSAPDVLYSPYIIQQERGQVSAGGSFLETRKFTFKPDEAVNLILETWLAGAPSVTVVKQAKHFFGNKAYLGASIGNGQDEMDNRREKENPFSLRAVDSQYRPHAQADANGNLTTLDWSDDGRQLRHVRDPLGNPTRFAYDALDRLVMSLDAEGRKTTYLYDVATREAVATLVADGENLVTNGDMEAASGWTAVGTVSHGQSATRVDGGSYAWYVAQAASGEGIESATFDLKSHRAYLFSARVFVESGSYPVEMKLSGVSMVPNAVESTSQKVWETLQAVYRPTSAQTGARLQFVVPSQASNVAFYVDNVVVTPLGEIDIDGDMEGSDTDWEAVSTPTTNTLVTSPVEIPGTLARQVITDASGEGVASPAIDLTAGRTYLVTARVRPAAANVPVALRLMDGASVLQGALATGGGVWQTLRFVYTATASVSGATVDCITDGGVGEFHLDSVHLVELHGLQRWQEAVYDARRRTVAERTIDVATAAVQQETTREFGTSGNSNGLLTKMAQVDVLNPGNDRWTEYTYDAAGRVVKTKQASLFGSCEFSYTVYDPAGNVLASVCGPSNVTPPTTVAEAIALHTADADNKVTTYEYDVMGRRTKTIVNDDGDPANINDNGKQNTLVIYDALDRVVRSITNYADQGAAPENWGWNETSKRWEVPGNPPVPVQHGLDNSRNLVSVTSYNAMGQVKSQMDVLGKLTLLGYDQAGRLLKTVVNPSQRDYNNDYDGDPSLGLYPEDVLHAVDEDIITEQEYDAAGNLVRTTDALKQRTFMVYDALNRLVKTVRSAKDSATLYFQPGENEHVPANDPRSASYGIDPAPDRDIVTTTVYDVMGRACKTTAPLDAATTQTQYTAFDALGRVSARIASYVPQGTSDPANWVWSVVNNRWEDGSGNPIAHGSLADQNILNATYYDSQGRVEATRDTLGRLTRFTYDGLGRQRKVIQNYVAQGTSDPANWVWSVANNRWEDGNGNPIAHGSLADQNLVAETTYNDDKQVQHTRDLLGRLTRFVYDEAGRQAKVIRNYVAQGTSDPLDWVWDAAEMQWEDGNGNPIGFGADDDQNVIVATAYDEAGRVKRVRDGQGRLTWNTYDNLGRLVKTITNCTQWEGGDPDDEEYTGSLDPDQDILTRTAYDLLGRVNFTTDALGRQTQFVYDRLSRRVKTIVNFVTQQGANSPANWLWSVANNRWEDGNGNAIALGAANDQNLIALTEYDRGSHVVATRDARGTQTTFFYDRAGRRLLSTAAAGTALETKTHTQYDKAGRVVQVTQNLRWMPWLPVPDMPYGQSSVEAVADYHGPANDSNLITVYTLDKLGRQVAVTDPAGNQSQTAYYRDGQVRQTTDPLGVVTAYRYDRARRRKLVVQNHVPGTLSDPDTWVWNGGWKDGSNVAIGHGSHNDQNVVVAVESDKAGRMTALRDPRGKQTTYTYDLLDRRIGLTNPLTQTWATAYARLGGGKMRTTLTDPLSQQTRQETDHLGRLQRIAYLDESVPKATPDVIFTYNKAGSRLTMREEDGQTIIRETHYAYDGLSRLASVGFDHDGGGSVDETVAYTYDAGGFRTRLTLPGNLTVTYEYDARGSLVRLTDWSGQATALTHDGLGRMRTTRRANGLESRYTYDVAGRLRKLAHVANGRRAAEFRYGVDARGNRTSTAEYTARADAGSMTVVDKDDSAVNYTGTWTDDGAFKCTEDVQAKVTVAFSGDNLAVTLGTGPVHGRCDLYLDGAFQDTVDLFAEEAGERLVGLTLTQAGAHTLEVRNRTDGQSGSNILRFKAVTLYALDLHTWQYTYDALARLQTAARFAETDMSIPAERAHTFAYDVAGNRIQQALSLNGGTPTVSDWEYNDVNQMTGSGIQYDAAGRMTSDGNRTLAWDRANRLASVYIPPIPGLEGSESTTTYRYNGMGNRIHRAVATPLWVDETTYLLDLQSGLVNVVAATNSQGTARYLHGPMGPLAQQDAASAWDWPLTDGLGSVRAVLDDAGNPLHALHYAPYGEPFEATGTPQLPHGFTGEPTDANGLLYLRARYYVPGLGVFPSLDPVEDGNRYAYVGGNVANRVDPSGMCWVNENSNQFQQDFCRDRFSSFVEDISRYYGTNSWPDDVRKAVVAHARFWANLEYSDFVSLWFDPTFTPSGGSGGFTGLVGQTNIAIDPASALVAAFIGVCAVGLGLLTQSTVVLPKRRTLGEELDAFIRRLLDSRRRGIPIPIPDDPPMPTPTPTRQVCRGYFVPGNKSIVFPSTGRSIADGFRTTQDDILGIMGDWLGQPEWQDPEGLYYSQGPCQDDGLFHRVRVTNRDTNAPQPHINIEAGLWIPKGFTASFETGGRNLHIFF